MPGNKFEDRKKYQDWSDYQLFPFMELEHSDCRLALGEISNLSCEIVSVLYWVNK